MDVSGVWRLWLTPRRKSSFTSLRWRSWRFWSWTWLNSSAFRMATPISLAYRSRSVWSARSQSRVAGRLARMRPIRSSPARSSARIGTRDARDALLGLHRVGVDEEDHGGDEPERRSRRRGRRVRPSRRRRPAARPIRPPPGSDPSCRLRRSASAARRLWLSASWARTSVPTTGIGWLMSPAETRDTAAEISRSGRTRSRPTAAPPRIPTTTATANMNSRRRVPMSGSTAPVTMSSRPKTPSGTIEAARSVSVSRVWNDSLPPRVAAGSAGPVIGRGRRGSRQSVRRRGGLVGDQPVADAADGQQVARMVGIGLELLPQAPHRDPHVGRLGVVRLRPAADHQGVRRDGLAEVGGEGEEEPRLGRRQLDGLAADDGLASVELEDRGPARGRDPCAAPARRPAAGPAGSARAAPSSGRAW